MPAGVILLRLAALVPWLHLVLFASFVMRAYAVLGRWPSFDRPDPKSLGFAAHHLSVVVSMLPALYGPLAVVPLAVILWRRAVSRELLVIAAVYALGTAMAWSLWWFDLGGLAEWVMD